MQMLVWKEAVWKGWDTVGVLGGAGCPVDDDVLQAGGSHEGLLMIIKCSLWHKGTLLHLGIKF